MVFHPSMIFSFLSLFLPRSVWGSYPSESDIVISWFVMKYHDKWHVSKFTIYTLKEKSGAEMALGWSRFHILAMWNVMTSHDMVNVMTCHDMVNLIQRGIFTKNNPSLYNINHSNIFLLHWLYQCQDDSTGNWKYW